MNLIPMKKIPLKLLIFTFFFIAIFFLGLKSVAAVDATDPGYYGYKSRKVVTEALVKHTEIPEIKRLALIDMLSKDGYFWMKTKQAKLNYIHTKLPSSKYLTIVADAENVHSWTLQPETSKSIALGNKNSGSYLYLNGKKSEQHRVKFKDVDITITGEPAWQFYKTHPENFQKLADKVIELRKKVQKLTSEKPQSNIVFQPAPLTQELIIETSDIQNAVGSGNRITIFYPGTDNLMIYSLLSGSWTTTYGVLTHEFGHNVFHGKYTVAGDVSSKEVDTLENARITVFHDNWKNAFVTFKKDYNTYYKDRTWWDSIFSADLYHIIGGHPQDSDNEFFASYFERYIQKTTLLFSTLKEVKNENKFYYESMATLIDGDNSKVHPYTHEPIKKRYSVQEIYNGAFLKK